MGKVLPPQIREEFARCRDNIPRFNRIILNRPSLWSKQAEICESFLKYRTTLVMSGNSCGKSFLLPALALHYLTYNTPSKIILTAPSETQLREVSWNYMLKAYQECPYRLFPSCQLYRQPLKMSISTDHFLLGYSTKTTEKLSGHHSDKLCVLVDESSGVERNIYEALDSLVPHRTVLIGNPLNAHGAFYDRCQRQMADPDPTVNLIKMRSIDGPDANIEHSSRGLASKSWLDAMRREWGEGSQWWKSHIMCEFPTVGGEALVPIDWIDRCQRHHRPGGQRKIAIDLSTGSGSDRSVVICADENGVIEWWNSKTAPMEETAWKAFEMRRKWDVSDHQVTFDAGGIGADFAFRLRSMGIANPTPYMGGKAVRSAQFLNHRSLSFWRLRRRLDPTGEHMMPYAMPLDLIEMAKREFPALTYELNGQGKVQIAKNEDVRERLGFSPDIADCMAQLFAY